MTRKEAVLIELLITKVESLHEEVKYVRHQMPKVVERVTALEKIVMFFKGATAVAGVALSYVISKLPFLGG